MLSKQHTQRTGRTGTFCSKISFKRSQCRTERSSLRAIAWNHARLPALELEMIIIVMGVSGSGKTTIGLALAKKLGVMFKDADDYHSQRNVEKMAKGIPLDDADRKEWLQTLSGHFRIWNMQGGAVLACSALKESYRAVLGAESDEIKWVYLSGTMEKIRERLDARTAHYFNPKLLESQFETLEEPEYGVQIEIDQSVRQIVEKLADIFK